MSPGTSLDSRSQVYKSDIPSISKTLRNILSDHGEHEDDATESWSQQTLGPSPSKRACSLWHERGGGTHNNHDVPPATLVEILHHGREVPEAVLVESEVPPGVHVVQVIPLDVLQPRHRAAGAQARCPRPTLGAPGPSPALTRGKCALVMFSTTWRVMAVEE